MTKDVLISIKGLQFDMQAEEAIEVISAGEYYFQGGKHFVLFDEISEDEDGRGGLTKSTLKASRDQIELIKKGVTNVHMIFEKGKKNMTYYNMPFGQLLIGLETNRIVMLEEEDSIGIRLEYGMDINYSFAADCTIDIKIIAK